MEGLVRNLGCFIGECIVRTFGGSWTQNKGSWGVQVNESVWACPFIKVQKQFDNGSEDSVASYFRSIAAVIKCLPQILKS